MVRQALQFFIWELEACAAGKIIDFAIAKAVATHHELKIKEFLEPIFVAITGKTSSTSVVMQWKFWVLICRVRAYAWR